jgi:hypothetical protein
MEATMRIIGRHYFKDGTYENMYDYSKEETEVTTKEEFKEAVEKAGGKVIDASEPAETTEATNDRVPQRFTGKEKLRSKIGPQEDNPRREGSHGHRSLQIIIDSPGITVEEYIAKGGRPRDLRWDIAKGFVKVTGGK